MRRRSRFCNEGPPNKNFALQKVENKNGQKSANFQHYCDSRRIFIVMCFVTRPIAVILSLGLFTSDANASSYSSPDYGATVRATRLLGEPNQYRAALLQFAAFSEILAAEGELGNSVLLDAMRAYYKLSVLEASLSQPAEAERYLERAVRICHVVREACDISDLAEYEKELEAVEQKDNRQW